MGSDEESGLKMIRRFLKRYVESVWLPAAIYVGALIGHAVTSLSRSAPLQGVSAGMFCVGAVGLLGVFLASLWNLTQQRWGKCLLQLGSGLGCCVVTIGVIGALAASSLFGPDEDGFADNLTIPAGIEISEPERDTGSTAESGGSAGVTGGNRGTDAMQDAIRQALAVAGGASTEFSPAMPSLRKAATDHAGEFREYIEASPDWHVFLERGNRFASRRWTYGGEPRGTLHGYVSEFGDGPRFQTRCLLCLDRKPWGRYAVQRVAEGTGPVKPDMGSGNALLESRVLVDCEGVWVEIFEQSDAAERRVTKATVAVLEREFAEFVKDPGQAVAKARVRSRELASRLAGKDGQPFRLFTGMQPGLYGVAYSLNPGEPGSVHLKAFEVTKGTRLSADQLEAASKTRMAWSGQSSERFGAKAGFTIYEGDWGKPYAARFEVWFRPDSGGPERKLAERVFRIEGWQR